MSRVSTERLSSHTSASITVDPRHSLSTATQATEILTEANVWELGTETRITELKSIGKGVTSNNCSSLLRPDNLVRELRERETRITELESIVEEKSDIQQLQQQLSSQYKSLRIQHCGRKE